MVDNVFHTSLKPKEGWNNGSVVKGTICFYRVPECNFLHPCSLLKLPTILFTGDPTYVVLPATHMVYIQTGTQISAETK